MTPLITLADFEPYKTITQNVKVKKLETFIGEAQKFDLRPLLGVRLFQDLITDFPTLTKYNDLFNGCSYTVEGKTFIHDGLKPVICYFTYARYIKNSQFIDTESGLVRKKTDESEPASDKAIEGTIQQARSGALAYWEEVEKFLNDNKSDYPLWNEDCNKQCGGKCRISSIG